MWLFRSQTERSYSSLLPLNKAYTVGAESTVRFILPLVVAGFLLVVGCNSATSSNSPSSNGEVTSAPNCAEPENPYDEGSGHYAGFEWAQNNNPGACDGNSESFIEGCEEYENQETAYEECEAK